MWSSSVVEPERISNSVGIWWSGIGCITIAGIALSARINPDSSRIGTNRLSASDLRETANRSPVPPMAATAVSMSRSVAVSSWMMIWLKRATGEWLTTDVTPPVRCTYPAVTDSATIPNPLMYAW